MAHYLTEADIEPLVTMSEIIDAVEKIIAAQAKGKAWLTPRNRLKMPKGMLHTMSASWPESGYFAHKAYASIASEIRFRVHLYSYDTGEIVCTMQGNRLGQMRTGAATAIAAKHLMPKRAPVWAIFGTGLQAYGQIEAMLEVSKPEELRIYSRSSENRQLFCNQLHQAFGIDATPSDSPEDCVSDADVIITATTSKDPVFSGKLIKKGAFIAPVGANLAIKRELDGSALKTIDRIIVDDHETAKIESGLLQTPIQAGFMQWSQIGTLPDLVAGSIPPRQSDNETLCFHSLGSATWDLAAGIVAFEKANDNDIGTIIPLD